MTTDPVPPSADNSTGKTTAPKNPWPRRLLIFGFIGFVTIVCINGLIFLVLRQTRGALVAAVVQVADGRSFERGVVARNQIAFVGNDNNLWLVSPDGENLQAITSDATAGGGYRAPTWSPDGQYIAFVGPRGRGDFALFLSSLEGNDPRVLYDSPGSAPFYLYWAPNGKEITFLTQELSGLSMRQASVQTGAESRLIGRGSPFYWTWSPDSARLLMHVGGARALSESAHISVLDNREDAQRIELKLAPGRFQAPVWSRDGQYAFYVAENDAGDEAIFRMDMDTLEQFPVASLEGVGQTFIIVSPDGQHIAYMEVDLSRPVPLGTPYLVNIDSQQAQAITNRSVMSMYWSPDGKKLALLTAGLEDEDPSAKGGGLAAPLAQSIIFRWWVYQLETETLDPLMTIRPTFDFMQTVPFFDQYHLSLTFWSPDSRYFVATTEISEDQEGAVIVIDTTGQEPSRQVGDGRLAIWSWK